MAAVGNNAIHSALLRGHYGALNEACLLLDP